MEMSSKYDDLPISPQTFQIAPVLISEFVLTLRGARFFLLVLRAIGASHAKSNGLKRFKGDEVSLKHLEAYAYAQTLVEILFLELLTITGVCGIHWTLDVPSGETVYMRELAVFATLQLFIHVVLSFTCLFVPDIITKALIGAGQYPLTLEQLLVVAYLLFDLVGHIANSGFLSLALGNKMSAGAIFMASALAYRFLDKGMLNLGEALRVQLLRDKADEVGLKEGGGQDPGTEPIKEE